MWDNNKAVLHTFHRLFHRKTAKTPCNRQAARGMYVKKSFFDRFLKFVNWFTEQHSKEHLRRKNPLLIFVPGGALRTQAGTFLQGVMQGDVLTFFGFV